MTIDLRKKPIGVKAVLQAAVVSLTSPVLEGVDRPAAASDEKHGGAR